MNWRHLWLRVQSLGFFVFAVIVAIGAGVLLFVPILHQRHNMQKEIRRLDAEIIRQENLEKQARTELEALKTDATFIERTARNKLNLARPNETVFRFDPQQLAPAPRR
jgi:cell division protein FtsB